MSWTWLGRGFDKVGGGATIQRRVAQREVTHVAQRTRRHRYPHIWTVAFPFVVWFAMLSGCSASHAPEADAAVIPTGCSGTAVCMGGTALYACQGGAIGPLLEDCSASGQVCSLARCTSSDCQKAETNSNSLVGCLFYTLEAENVVQDEGDQTSFLVTNPGDDPATVEIQSPAAGAPGDGTQWSGGTSIQVAGGASGRLPWSGYLEVTDVGVHPLAAVRLSSDRPVTAVEIESDDLGQNATSTGGTTLLPLQSLGIDYLSVTYPQLATAAIQSTDGSRGGAGRVIVVGTQMGTTIHLTPVGPVTTALDGAPNGLQAGQDYQVTLNDGDVFQLYSGADLEDLTGSRVTALQPFAVFSGNITTTYGSQVTGINSPDLAHEQMPPLVTWSQTYVAAALTPQSDIECTSFFGLDGASIWRVLGSVDGTTITFDGPGAGTLERLSSAAVAEPLVQPLLLGAGEGASLVGLGSFTVTATSPILVTQGLDCEPSLSLAIAADAGALFKNLPFAVLPYFDQMLGVARPLSSEVDLDGAALPDGLFQPAGNAFEVAQISLPACPPAEGVCTHTLTSAMGFGMTLRGMDVASSYTLTPPALRCDPANQVCLN
jgi:hypothetical protein